MCNRLPEINKNGDAGIFPVYYSLKTVGYGSASCWGDLGAGSVEADVFYIPFIVSVQYIGY